MARRTRTNPFWVTPQGTAVYQTPDRTTKKGKKVQGQWSRYQAKHPTRRLPRQASREADLETVTLDTAPGWELAQFEQDGQLVTILLFEGRDTGHYTLDPRKAAKMTFQLDKKRKQAKKGARRARRNPAKTEAQQAWLDYQAAGKARGWSRKKTCSLWARKRKASQKRERTGKDVYDVAFVEIYHLAEKVFGHSEFIHSSGMFDWSRERKMIKAELYSPKWSRWFEPAPLKTFVAGLRKIQKKHRPHGLKMTVAVKNPRAR